MLYDIAIEECKIAFMFALLINDLHNLGFIALQLVMLEYVITGWLLLCLFILLDIVLLIANVAND